MDTKQGSLEGSNSVFLLSKSDSSSREDLPEIEVLDLIWGQKDELYGIHLI